MSKKRKLNLVTMKWTAERIAHLHEILARGEELIKTGHADPQGLMKCLGNLEIANRTEELNHLMDVIDNSGHYNVIPFCIGAYIVTRKGEEA